MREGGERKKSVVFGGEETGQICWVTSGLKIVEGERVFFWGERETLTLFFVLLFRRLFGDFGLLKSVWKGGARERDLELLFLIAVELAMRSDLAHFLFGSF